MNSQQVLEHLWNALAAHPPAGVEAADVHAFFTRRRSDLLRALDRATLLRDVKPTRIVPGPIEGRPAELVFRVLQKGAGFLDVHQVTGVVDFDCAAASRRLQSRVGPRMKGHFVVAEVWVHPRLRGEGRAAALYRCALREAARRGYALAPHACLRDGSTSPEATRVWSSLRAHAVHEGDVLWGGLLLEQGQGCGEHQVDSPSVSAKPGDTPAPTPTVGTEAVPARQASPGTPTPWGGRKGAPLNSDHVQKGQRAVTRTGEHGVVADVTRYVSRVGDRITDRITSFEITLDSGRTTRGGALWEERVPPTQVVPDIRLDGRWFEPGAVWTALTRSWASVDWAVEKARSSRGPDKRAEWEERAQRNREEAGRQLRAFQAWREAWPDVEISGFDPQIYHQLTQAALGPLNGTEREGELEGGDVSPVGPGAESSGREGCFELNFDLAGHGRIRVVCGQPGRRDEWHNLHVGSDRYGWNGRRWARGQIPPKVVLEAVRVRGITAFGEG